jgi:hypothetical protein
MIGHEPPFYTLIDGNAIYDPDAEFSTLKRTDSTQQ